jgi:hypothetical protein
VFITANRSIVVIIIIITITTTKTTETLVTFNTMGTVVLLHKFATAENTEELLSTL